MDLMSIDLFCATSDRMPESVAVLGGLCRGTVIVWTGASHQKLGGHFEDGPVHPRLVQLHQPA